MHDMDAPGSGKQLGLFDPRQAVAVERLRAEEGDALAGPVADGLFDTLCRLYSRAPYLNVYWSTLTQRPDDATDLHVGATAFAAQVAERCEGGGAILVEDQDLPTARQPEPKRHFHGVVVTADSPAAIRGLWMEHAQATAQGTRIEPISGSSAPWDPRNFPLRSNLRRVAGYALGSAKTALMSRQVLVSGALARTWEGVRINVTISVTNNVTINVTPGEEEPRQRMRRIIDRGPRFCSECGAAIPSEMNARTRFYPESCRAAAYRRRKAENEQRRAAGGAP